jgi:hypothetical protein
MDVERQLLDLEEQFWKGDAEFYRRNLTDDALMVFAEPVGVLTKDQTVQAIAGSPRWVEIGIRDVRMVRLAEDAVIATYKVSARRERGAAPYPALASSAYVNRQGAWKLAFHQQTPGG